MNEQEITTSTANLEAQPASNPALQPVLPGAGHFIAVNHHPGSSLQTVSPPDTHGVTVIDTPSKVGRASSHHSRNGKIARLPKLYRDLVNDLLFKNVSYSKIVSALEEHVIIVTERNISNWKTRGGYRDWCAEQERQIHLSHAQDNLADYLRNNDATQIPEVGLQIAATQLSQMLLQPEYARQFASDPKQFSLVVNMLCKLSDQIKTLQQERDEAVRKSEYRHHHLEYSKRQQAESIEGLRRAYSCPKPGGNVYEEDPPHRNDLPQRDAPHLPECSPKEPSYQEMMRMARELSAKRKAAQSAPDSSTTVQPNSGDSTP